MKKNLLIMLLVLILCAFLGVLGFYYLSPQVAEPSASVEKVEINNQKTDEADLLSYKKGNLSSDCSADSKMLCAVDFAVKCTIDPEFEGCRESRLPKYIFMQDESLNRPTEISFVVRKIKPISADVVEVHTDSKCNGTWFGLCQGRVIYVVVPQEDTWRVKDVYAIENREV